MSSCIGVQSGKAGVEHLKSAKTPIASLVVAVIVTVLLVSPLIAGYIMWFKYHRTRKMPKHIDQEHLTVWDEV